MKIFVGPTTPSNIPTDATILPPAQQGDIAAAALQGQDTLILIDGLYHQNLAPWHKEILFALEQGCRFIGAGSLGALRAVECARYGAEPIGIISEWYANESCTDDADVAVAHAPVSEGSKCHTIPIVNLRATLEALAADGLFRFPDIPGLLDKARNIYFAERTWDALKPIFGKMEFDWVKHNYIDQKSRDAEAAIRHASSVAAPVPTLPEVIHTAHLSALLSNDLPIGDGQRLHHLATQREAATDRHLVAELARLLGLRPDAHAIRTASAKMWDRLGINNPAQAEKWFQQNHATDAAWYAEAEREALRQAARDWWTATHCAYDTVPLTRAHQLLNP